MAQGEAAGIIDTKLTVRNMLEQLDDQLKLKPEALALLGADPEFPETHRRRGPRAADQRIPPVDHRRRSIRRCTRLRDFLQTEYLPMARDGVGLIYMKGGDALYRYLVQSTTTLPMTPDEIHQLGLSEVARITRDFDKVRQEVGFKGDLQQFFDYMRTSPKFQPKSRE